VPKRQEVSLVLSVKAAMLKNETVVVGASNPKNTLSVSCCAA